MVIGQGYFSNVRQLNTDIGYYAQFYGQNTYLRLRITGSMHHGEGIRVIRFKSNGQGAEKRFFAKALNSGRWIEYNPDDDVVEHG